MIKGILNSYESNSNIICELDNVDRLIIEDSLETSKLTSHFTNINFSKWKYIEFNRPELVASLKLDLKYTTALYIRLKRTQTEIVKELLNKYIHSTNLKFEHYISESNDECYIYLSTHEIKSDLLLILSSLIDICVSLINVYYHGITICTFEFNPFNVIIATMTDDNDFDFVTYEIRLRDKSELRSFLNSNKYNKIIGLSNSKFKFLLDHQNFLYFDIDDELKFTLGENTNQVYLETCI